MPMHEIRRLAQVLCLAALLPIHFAVAAGSAPVPKSVSLDVEKFNDKAIEAFIGDAEVTFPEEYEPQTVPVSDRIFAGLEAAARRLILPDGTTIDWGFKYKEAFLKSVIVYDRSGHPRLLAAAAFTSGIIARRFNEPKAVTPEQYRKAINGKHDKTMVTVFVRDKRDLETYLPYLKRWLQADLLGMHVDCTQPDMAQACRFAGEVEVPTRAYLLANKRKPLPISVPHVKAANIPLAAFR